MKIDLSPAKFAFLSGLCSTLQLPLWRQAFLPALLLILFVQSSCSEKSEPYEPSSSSLVFGHFYGMCWGEYCVETFLLDDAHLYEDTVDHYMGDSFDFVQLSEEKYQIAKVLLDDFPAELMHATDSVYGCPDCYDQGGILLKYMISGTETRTFILDNNQAALPSYLDSYAIEVHEIIEALQ